MVFAAAFLPVVVAMRMRDERKRTSANHASAPN